MKTQESFDDIWKRVASPEEYATDKNVLRFITELNRLLERRGLSRREFADKLGTSKAYVTRVFKGDSNFTISTMTRLAHALGGTIDIHVTPKEEQNVKWFRVLASPRKRPDSRGVNWNIQSMETEFISGADDYREVVLG